MMGMMGFGYLWMALGALILIGIVALAAWAALHLSGGRGPSEQAGAPSAREILDQRYAAGEIDYDEYRRRRTDLGDGGSQPP